MSSMPPARIILTHPAIPPTWTIYEPFRAILEALDELALHEPEGTSPEGQLATDRHGHAHSPGTRRAPRPYPCPRCVRHGTHQASTTNRLGTHLSAMGFPSAQSRPRTRESARIRDTYYGSQAVFAPRGRLSRAIGSIEPGCRTKADVGRRAFPVHPTNPVGILDT